MGSGDPNLVSDFSKLAIDKKTLDFNGSQPVSTPYASWARFEPSFWVRLTCLIDFVATLSLDCFAERMHYIAPSEPSLLSAS